MEWARAKNIIILLLLAFNIFLLTNIITYARSQGIPGETIRNTEEILAGRGVTLECAIPDYNRDTPKLTYGNDMHYWSLIAKKLLGDEYVKGADGSSFTAADKKLIFQKDGIMTFICGNPQDTVDMVHTGAADAYVRKFLKGGGLLDSSFVLDYSVKNSDGSVSLGYIEKYKGFLIFDNYLNIKLTEKGIISIESRRMKIEKFSKDRAGDIAAAYQVLLGNFKDGGKLTITNIDIGYKIAEVQDTNGLETSEHFPVWRVRIKGSETPRYFNTADGKEVKQNINIVS